jgi:hypothetical protein
MLVPEGLRKCVMFIGIEVDGRFLPRATGFLVIFREHGHDWSYLVTAEHVISALLSKGHEIFVRYNTKNGSVVNGPIPHQAWTFHPEAETDPTDVAIALFLPEGDEAISGIEVNGPYSVVCTEAIRKEHQIGPGEEISIIGLFRTHHGVDKIIPVVRTGHIATMREEPVSTKYCGHVEAYLVEAMSIAGLSGSPVFAHLAPLRVVENEVRKLNGIRFWLLGLMHGHFDVQNLNEDVATDLEGQSLSSINAGLGVVIPSEKIVETILHPDAANMRKTMATELRKRDRATSAAASEEVIPPANGETPTQKD